MEFRDGGKTGFHQRESIPLFKILFRNSEFVSPLMKDDIEAHNINFEADFYDVNSA